MKFNPFDKKYLATPRSRLIWSIISFECISGILWFFFVVLGDMDSEGNILLTIFLGVVGALAGTLMWATVGESLRKATEREMIRRNSDNKNTSNADKYVISARTINLYKKKNLTTPRATLIYSMIVIERAMLFAWGGAIIVAFATGVLSWGLTIIAFIAVMICGAGIGFHAWKKIYEPTRKKIEQQEREAAESPQP